MWVFGTSETGRHSDTCIAINKDMVKNIYFTRDAPEEAIYIQNSYIIIHTFDVHVSMCVYVCVCCVFVYVHTHPCLCVVIVHGKDIHSLAVDTLNSFLNK